MDAFFERTFALAREGKPNPWGLPGPLQLAAVADEFSEELYFAGVPLLVQRVVAGAVGPVARLVGYRSRYDRYEA